MSKLVLLQTVAPDYRRKLFATLESHLKDDFILYAGNNYFEESVKTDSNINLERVDNFYFFGRRFLFQFGMWKEALKSDYLIIEMNPRILSNWILLIIRKISGRTTILWGHAWPRGGQKSRTDLIRHKMRQLGDIIITYTRTQSQELQERMPHKKIVTAPNSLYYKSEMQASLQEKISNIIYVGRLTALKKPELLVEAFAKVMDKVPQEAKLIIVGDGNERNSLVDFIQKRGLDQRIKLSGHIGDYKRLKELYNSALFSVSPGYVGLSITQSFSFGVPMLISKDENHSPEIEAATSENSVFFTTDDSDDLADKILDFYQQKEHWLGQRSSICEACKERYSIEAMSQTFLDLIVPNTNKAK